MQIKESNNDQNIHRVLTKMSEDCSSQNNVNLTGRLENFNFISNVKSRENKDDSNLTYDHMYASNTENLHLSSTESDCQNTENEVKFLKEWLLTHLDLIQQQNDEILNKEKTILILKQENEMLKERINGLDPNLEIQKDNKLASIDYSNQERVDEMTHDSANDEDNCESTIYILQKQNDIEQPVYELLENSSAKKEIVNNDPQIVCETSPNNSLSYDVESFAISNSVENFKNLKMSIRRKRLCSSSSALSNNDISTEETHALRKKKKRKSSIRDDKIITSIDPYVTQIGESTLLLPHEINSAIESSSTNLEVPRWRVKVYTSCYSMEGTENLDDEVYNKRHVRLENDERRRKRWDVQRIREQRIVEKLKQRQERIGSGSRIDEQSESIKSFWPPLEDIKCLEVCDQLPVSAFGVPIPRFIPMEFCLPWLSNHQSPSDLIKKNNNRKSTIKRKATKR